MSSGAARPIDPARCPLCQADNACGAARGAGTCWCFAIDVPEAVLARLPDQARGVACVCERCASAGRGAEAPSPIDRPDRTR